MYHLTQFDLIIKMEFQGNEHSRDHREERKSGKIIGDIKIGPKRYYCAVAL